METISSEIARLKALLEKAEKVAENFKDMYERCAEERNSLDTRLQTEMINSNMYREWFTRNQYWTLIHNNMMKYDPKLGQYTRRGGQDPIEIPKRPVFEIVRGTHKKISPVAEDIDEE